MTTKKKIKWYRTFPFHALAILLISIIPFLFFLQIEFFFGEELFLEIIPNDIYLESFNKENISLTIIINIQNSPLCSAECNKSIIKLDTGEKKESNTEIIRGRKEISENIELDSNEKGEKISIYRIDTTCVNKKTVLCPSKEESRQESSFIIADFILNDEEEKAKKNFLNKSEIIIRLINKIDSQQKRIKELLLASKNYNYYSEIKDIDERYELFNKNLFFQEQRLINMLNLYNNQSYDKLKEYNFSTTIDQLELIDKSQTSEIENSIEFIKDYNKIIESIKSIDLDSAIETYKAYLDLYELNRSYLNLAIELSEDMQIIYESIEKIKQKKEISFDNIINSTDNIKKEIDAINHILTDLINNSIEKINKSIEEELIIDDNLSIKEKIDILIQINILNNNTERIPYFFNITKDFDLIDIPQEKEYREKKYNIKEHLKECCFYGYCRHCKENSSTDYPTLFIHGHQFNKEYSPEYSMNSFSELMHELEKKGFINTGKIDLDSQGTNEWNELNRPIIARASYLYITHLDLGVSIIQAQKDERIENYAIRLKEIINNLKRKTGKDKVNIVAHSMGGLVARQYLSLFGEEDVDKLIMIGTPNHGVAGKVKDLCMITGAKKQCEDMSEGSIFIKRLNSKKLDSVKTYTIIGTGCEMESSIGDGIVLTSNSRLEGSKEFIIEGNCTDLFNTNLHGNLLKPTLYPKVVNIIQEILLSKD